MAYGRDSACQGRDNARESPLDVVIVAYQSRKLVHDCLKSLRHHAPSAGMTTFVVDNSSSDGTVDMIRAEFREVHVISNERNVGFAVGSNVGIRSGHARYVLVLNPDTRISAGALDALLALMDRRPDIGICGCRLLRDDGSFDHAAKRSFPTILGALGHFLHVGRRPNAPTRLSQYRATETEAGPVDAVNGAFMLIRRRALDEVGLFDEGFWMYMEDLDLCFRFQQAGWLTWYEPSVIVHHVKGGTTGPLRGPRLNYAFHYGMYRFYRKHYAK